VKSGLLWRPDRSAMAEWFGLLAIYELEWVLF